MKKTNKKADKNSIQLEKADADTLREVEQSVLKYKLRLADIEMMIAELNKEKQDLFGLVKEGNDSFISSVKEFAVKSGINPDGDPSEDKWNLDTYTMTFNKVQ